MLLQGAESLGEPDISNLGMFSDLRRKIERGGQSDLLRSGEPV